MSTGDQRATTSFAPADLTDGRKEGDWKSSYPAEARKLIRWEGVYLVIITILSLAGVFYLVGTCSDLSAKLEDRPHEPTRTSEGLSSSTPGGTGDNLSSISSQTNYTNRTRLTLLGFVAAFCAGTLGGCVFGIKCMYHFIAKRLWNEDRRPWRLLAPPLSGIVALIMVFLVASGFLQIFDASFIEKTTRVIAFSALVGIFSDKAIAKMSEVADTVFGAHKPTGSGAAGRSIDGAGATARERV